MAVAAVAHIFVFSAKPYHFVAAPAAVGYKKVTVEETSGVVEIDEGDKEEQAVVEKTETEVEAAGTNIKESIHDLVVEGGQEVSLQILRTSSSSSSSKSRGNSIMSQFLPEKVKVEE